RNVENAVDVCGKGLALPIMESPLAQKSKTGIDVGSTSVMVEITSR
ncbi:24927_t:CDS:1, partial [Gigaspora rosea]